MNVNLKDRLAVLTRFRETLQLNVAARNTKTDQSTAESIEKVISEFKLPKEIDTPETRAKLKEMAHAAAKDIPEGTVLSGIKVCAPRSPSEVFEQMKLLEATDEKCTELEHDKGQLYIAGAIAALQWAVGMDNTSPLKKLAGALQGCGDAGCTSCGELKL